MILTNGCRVAPFDQGIAVCEYADAAARLAATGMTASDVGKVVSQLDNNSYWVLVNHDPLTWSVITSAGVTWVEDEFEAQALQTVFTLSKTPVNNDTLSLCINGVRYDDEDEYTVVGTTLTWLDTPFVLDAGDEVVVRYME